MGNKLVISLLFLFITTLNFGQENQLKIDSLLKKLPLLKKDTTLVRAYFDLASLYQSFDNNKTKAYLKKAKHISDEINFAKGKIQYYAFYSGLLENEGKFDEAIQMNKTSIELSKKIKDNYRLACSYFNLAKTYQYKEDYKKALNYYLLSDQIFKKEKVDKFASTLNMNLGVLYNEIGQHQKALNSYTISEKICRDKKDDYNLCMVLVNKTDTECTLNQLYKAKTTIEEAIGLARKLENEIFLQAALITLCDIKLKSKDYEGIYDLSAESLRLSEKFQIIEGINKSLRGIATYYFYKKDFNKAENYAKTAYNKIVNQEYDLDKIETSYLLSNIYLGKNDLENFEKYKSIGDSLNVKLNLEENSNQIAELETKYQTEKKNLQIQNLQTQSKKRFWVSIALGLGIIGVGGIAYLQFKNYKTKKALLLVEQDKAVAEERLRIATDMHDDVGTGLSRIRYITNAVKTGETSKEEGLSKVTEISDDTITKMSEIIWALNESNQTLEELIYFIRSQASEMVENAKLNFNGILPETIPDLSFGWMRNRNTYLLAKETINNAIKHAQAKTISIQFEINDQLIITIKDDGIGFDTTKKFNGNGLNNYQKRIEKLGGTHSITSSENEGTTIVYRIPLT